MALSNIWEIVYGDVKKTAAEWGATEITRSRHNQGGDVVSIHLDGLRIDADPPFASKQTITILRAGVPWFFGLRVRGAAIGTPKAEDGDLVFHGPFWWLETIIYQQDFMGWLGAETSLVKNSDLTMNLVVDGVGTVTKISTRQQIINILNYAISCGAPLQIDMEDIPDVDIPITNARDVSCMEALRQQLRWSPNAAMWVDCSTTPPTIRIKPREKLTDASFSVAPSVDDADLESFQIEPRYDLQIPEVVLKWKRIDVQNGTPYTRIYQDVYPPPAEGAIPGARPEALVSTLDLRGSVTSQATAEIETAEIKAMDADKAVQLAWWKTKLPHLGESIVKNLVIEGATRETDRKYEMFGQSARWMGGETGEESITCLVSYDLRDKTDSETIVKAVRHERASIRLTTTSLTAGSFSQGGVVDYGEPQPVGLAEWLWKQTNPLVFDGGISLAEKECDSAVGIGHVVNITDGRPEWATMRAVVQQVSEVLSSGKTTLILGYPKHLGIDDIVEYLRAARATQRTSGSEDISTGLAYGGRSIELGNKTRMQDTLNSHGFMTLLTMKDPTNPTSPVIKLDLADLIALGAALQASFQEITCCREMPDGTEVREKRKFLCTDAYESTVVSP